MQAGKHGFHIDCAYCLPFFKGGVPSMWIRCQGTWRLGAKSGHRNTVDEHLWTRFSEINNSEGSGLEPHFRGFGLTTPFSPPKPSTLTVFGAEYWKPRQPWLSGQFTWSGKPATSRYTKCDILFKRRSQPPHSKAKRGLTADDLIRLTKLNHHINFDSNIEWQRNHSHS